MKRKVIIIANIEESAELNNLAEKLNSDILTVDSVYETSFMENDECSLTALAIETDAVMRLEHSEKTVTRERIVKLANHVASGDDLTEEIAYAMDRGYASLESSNEL